MSHKGRGSGRICIKRQPGVTRRQCAINVEWFALVSLRYTLVLGEVAVERKNKRPK